MTPSVGRMVHYVSFGTPGGEFGCECRAAVVTEVVGIFDEDNEDELVGWDLSLAVLNPGGMFFNRSVPQDEDKKLGGTWHWPERVE